MDALVLDLMERELRRLRRRRVVALTNGVAMSLTLAAALMQVLPRPLLLAFNVLGTACALLVMRAAWRARQRLVVLDTLAPLRVLLQCAVELEPGVRVLGVERADGDTITVHLCVDGRRGTAQLPKRVTSAVSDADGAFDALEAQLRATVSPDPN